LDLIMDSSVALRVCLAGGAIGPLAEYALHAPALLPSEVTSALRELSWRGEIPVEQGREALDHLAALPITYAVAGSLSAEAWSIAVDLGWAKTYDAEFVALAARLDCPLITADARLQRRAGHRVVIQSPAELSRSDRP
jgi:predicted nucleic acid-binding protein